MENIPFANLVTSGVQALPNTDTGGQAAMAAGVAGALNQKMATPNSQAATFNDIVIPVYTPDGGMSGLGSIHKSQSPARAWSITIDTTNLPEDTTHTIRLFDAMEGAKCFSRCDDEVPEGVITKDGTFCGYEQLLRWFCGTRAYLINSVRMTVSGSNDLDVDMVKQTRIWTYSFDESGHRQEGSFYLGLHNDPNRQNSDVIDIPMTDRWSVISSNVGWELRNIPSGVRINLLIGVGGRFYYA